MAETQSPPRLVRFGAFEADLRTGELRKDGVKLKFSGQPFQVLAILLERPGDVVTREELQKRLWPDTFVDVERNLNTAVNKIREVLGDSRRAHIRPNDSNARIPVYWHARTAGAASSSSRADACAEASSETAEGRRRRPRYYGPCVWGYSRLPMASAAASAGAGGFNCRSVYRSVWTGDCPGILSRWLPDRFRMER